MSPKKSIRSANLEGLNIRKLELNESDDFVSFFKNEGQLNQSLEEFKWQYSYNSNTVKDVFLAEPKEEVERIKNIFAAVYCISHRKFLIEKKEYLGSLSLQTLTGLSYRYRGLFVHLAKTCYNHAKSDGVKFVYGSPNDNSMPSFLKHLNWEQMPKINVLAKFNLYEYTKGKFGLRKKNFNKRNGKIFQISEFYEPLNILWNQFSKNINTGLVRDANFWNWRYLQRPFSNDRIYVFENKKGELLASCAISISDKKEGKRGYIMDFMVKPNAIKEGSLLLNWCSSLLIREGCLFVVVCQSEGNPFKKNLKLARFHKIPKYFHPKGPCLALTVLDPNLESMLKNSNGWHITYGDFDVL